MALSKKVEKGKIIKRAYYEITPKGEEFRKQVSSEINSKVKKTSKLVKEGRVEEAKQEFRELIPYVRELALLRTIEDLLLLQALLPLFGLDELLLYDLDLLDEEYSEIDVNSVEQDAPDVSDSDYL